MSSFVNRLVANDTRFEALALVLKHDGLKLLCMIRLCPLPYSLSNGAIATFPTVEPLQFALATAITCPKLLIHVFIGSRLAVIARSGEKMDAKTKAINYTSIAIGAVLGIATGWVIYQRCFDLILRHSRTSLTLTGRLHAHGSLRLRNELAYVIRTSVMQIVRLIGRRMHRLLLERMMTSIFWITKSRRNATRTTLRMMTTFSTTGLETKRTLSDFTGRHQAGRFSWAYDRIVLLDWGIRFRLPHRIVRPLY